MINLKEKVEEIKIRAKEVLEKDGYHSPMVIGFRDNKAFIISVPAYNTDEEKEKVFGDLTVSLRNLKADMFIHIFEAWMVMRKENEELNTNIMPSKHPNRVEVLYISGKTKHQTYSIYIPFIRLGKRIIFEKEEIIDANKGFYIEDNLFKNVFNEKEDG